MRRTIALLTLALVATFAAAQSGKPAKSAALPSKLAASSTTLPDTPAGRLLGGWLDAFNSGDQQKLTKFIADHYSESERSGRPAEEQAVREMQFRAQTGGGYHLAKVLSSEPNKLTAVLRERDEFGYMRVTFNADEKNPQIIATSNFTPTSAPSDERLPKLTVAELASQLDARLNERTTQDLFSGVVLIAKDGKPIFEKVYGLADRDKKTPNALDTRFRLGSMNKMFTATSIAQLVQQGRLNYTDTISQVLPDYPNKEVAQKVTVHQLLTHSSGLADIFGPAFMEKKDSLRTVADYLQLFVNKPLEFEPGTKFRYSNAGFIVLGLIIEKLSGQTYYDYVQRHIYDVAYMKASGSTPKTEQDDKIAIGYTSRGPRGPEPLHNNFDTLPWRGMSAGGGQSTAQDMLRFATALKSNKLLSAEQAKTITTGKFPTVDEDYYAYGFLDKKDSLGRYIGHGGGAPGMNGELRIYDNGYTIIVLSNLDPPAATKVASYIANRLK